MFICAKIGINLAVSNYALKPMLCLKSDWDLDNTWAVPSKTNLQLTQDSVTWDDLSEVGAVNLLPNNATTQTISGITFTVNDNRSITFSGTASSNIYLTISTFTLSAGTYKLNGANGGVQYKVDIQLIVGGNLLASDYSNGATFTLASDTVITARIRIESGYAISGSLIFKPMIAPASYNGPYVPYAKTNKELTEDVESIETEMVRGGGYVYKITSYFRHITITAPRGIYGLVKLFTQHGEVLFSTDATGIVANTLNTQKVLLNRTDSSAVWTYTINGLSVAFDLGISATAIIFSTIPLEITTSSTSTPGTNTMEILNLALLSNS